MIDPKISPQSAKRVTAQILDYQPSEDEQAARHLLATHAPHAPKTHNFDAHTVFSSGPVAHSLVASAAAGPLRGLDYSAGRPSIPAMQQWGSVVSIRYNPYGPGGEWKQWTDDERRALHAAGIGLHPNFEISGEEPFSGGSEGERLGVEVVRALAALGVPLDGTVGDFYSMDREITTPQQMDTVIDFYRRYNHVLTDSGLAYGSGYGQYWLMLRLAKDLGLIGWQTYAWSYGSIWDAAACQSEGVSSDLAVPLYQWNNSQLIGGQDADLNHVFDPYRLRAWWPAGSPYAQGDDMSQADVDNINTHIASARDQILAAAGWDHVLVASDKSKPVGTGEQALSDARQISRRNEVKIDALAGALQTLLKNDVTEQQKLDALTALEQAQTAAETQADSAEASALAQIQQALQSSAGGVVDIAALSSALAGALGPDLAEELAAHLTGTLNIETK